MLTGELYRKLPKVSNPADPSRGELSLLDLEDVIVADAFGGFRYLPRLFLAGLLAKARRTSDGAPVPEAILKTINDAPWSVDFSFWPAWSVLSDFAWSGGNDLGGWSRVRSCEPDVVVATTQEALRNQRQGVLLVMEAKWIGSELGTDVSQLAREYACGMKLAREMEASGCKVDFVLLTVTRRRRAPLVCEPLLAVDGQAITGSSAKTILPHRQVSAYLELVGRYFRPDLREVLENWAAEASTRIWHASWQDVGNAYSEGLEALRQAKQPVQGHPEFFCFEGVRRLAEEVAHSLLVRRDLVGFSGFEAIDQLELDPALIDRPCLFFDCRSTGRGDL